jgi:hypothetical protein
MGSNVQTHILPPAGAEDGDFERTPEVPPPAWIPPRWWYLTPLNEVHGPFDWFQMTDWNLKRWFTPSLRIRPEGFECFYEIQHLYPMPRRAFVTEPAVPTGEFLPPTREINWWDLLFEACEAGLALVVLLLYSLGADIDEAQFDGWTPAHIASGNGHAAVVRLLRDLGANLSAENDEGQTPTSVAISRGHMAVVQLLDVRAGRRG